MLRRRREQKTDYEQRLALLKSGLPRLVVRKSLNGFCVQLIEYGVKGDRVIAETNSSALRGIGWNGHCGNIPAAYLSGLYIAKLAKNKNVKEAVLDIGMQSSTKGNSLYAVAKGANDGGLNVPLDNEMVPSMDRITGKKIDEYRKTSITQNFEEVKKKILG